MQAVILAGGLGTRLRPFTYHMPKPMITIGDKPFLEYLINQVKGFGISEILILLGYLPEKVIEYFGDGSKWGIDIIYDITPVEYNTGARINAAKNKIRGDFLLMYCDNYCPINIHKALKHYKDKDALIQLTTYSNKDNYTKNNIFVNECGIVEIYDKRRQTKGLNVVDIGYAIVNHSVLSLIPNGNISFEEAIYPKLVVAGKLSAYVTDHRYVSIGSLKRLDLTKQFFIQKKVIFLDRDGTLNKRAPKASYTVCPEEFIWLPGSKEAVKKLTDAGYIIILVTNQPGIARKMVTLENLDAIHKKMLKELADIGGKIDKMYYCPHGWEEGCDCRKPKPGMLYAAQREYNLNLSEAFFIGDDERDIEAASAADVKGILIDEEYTLIDAVNDLLNSNKVPYLPA